SRPSPVHIRIARARGIADLTLASRRYARGDPRGRGNARAAAEDRLEAAALARSQLDLTAVRVNEPLHDREPEPETGLVGAAPPEAIEGVRDLLGGHAGTAIPDTDLDQGAGSRGSELDVRAGGRDLESVREQVVENLLQPTRRGKRVQATLDPRHEPDLLLLGERRPGLDSLSEPGGDIELGRCAGGPVGASEGEQPVNERAQ